MIRLALLGKNISHSKSQATYEELLKEKIDYKLFDYQRQEDIPELSYLLSKRVGLSITSPYKKFFLKQLILDDEIRGLKAINCVKQVESEFHGTNTDYFSLLEHFNHFQKMWETPLFIVLGGGTMAKVCQTILEKKSLEYYLFTRRKDGDLSQIKFDKFFNRNHQVVFINTCSRDFIYNGPNYSEAIFWDLNYNFPAHSNTLPQKFQSYLDGLSLLQGQAKHALRFWGLRI